MLFRSRMTNAIGGGWNASYVYDGFTNLLGVTPGGTGPSAMSISVADGRLGLLAIVNPMVSWIWAATAVMAAGGLIALIPPRRPRPHEARPAQSAPIVAAGYAAVETSG